MYSDDMRLTLQLKTPLKKKLEAKARSERRTAENEAICLIENALEVFEQGREDRRGETV